MTRVNLLPESFAARRRQSSRRVRAAVVAAFVVTASAALAAGAVVHLEGLSARIATAEAALAQAQSRRSDSDSRLKPVAAAAALLDQAAQLELPVPAAAVVALLTQNLPESLVLERMAMQAPAPPVGSTAPADAASAGRHTAAREPVRVTIEGVAVSDVDAANLASGLSKQAVFADVKLVRSRQLTYGNLSRYGFEISFAVRVPQGGKPDHTPGSGRAHAS